MRLAGFGLLLAAVCVAVWEFVFTKGVLPPADSFSDIGLTYAIAGIMAAGGVALLLLGGGPHPVEDEYESPGLRLVG